jgi:hypothetical protein
MPFILVTKRGQFHASLRHDHASAYDRDKIESKHGKNIGSEADLTTIRKCLCRPYPCFTASSCVCTFSWYFIRLQNHALFQAARVVAGSVEWPGGLDLSYDTLYLESQPTEAIATEMAEALS